MSMTNTSKQEIEGYREIISYIKYIYSDISYICLCTQVSFSLQVHIASCAIKYTDTSVTLRRRWMCVTQCFQMVGTGG